MDHPPRRTTADPSGERGIRGLHDRSTESDLRPERPREMVRSGEVVGGRYEVRAVLGRGGMGTVFEAVDLELSRPVALKVVKNRPNASQSWRERFQREGEIAASLQHPGIVGVHSTGVHRGLPYLVYEMIEGARTLEEVLPSTDLRQGVSWMRDVAQALGHAHAHGVVHRDVKPENVLLDGQDRVRVTDFGVAVAEGLERLTRTGAIMGTPRYMAPEQIVGKREQQGPHSDVWALGIMLYERLAGESPFTATDLVNLSVELLRSDPKPPSDLARGVPPELEAICLRALEKDPADRYVDGAALAADLERYLRGEPVEAVAIRAGRRRKRIAWALLAVAGLVGSVGLALAWERERGVDGSERETTAEVDPQPDRAESQRGDRELEALSKKGLTPKQRFELAEAWLEQHGDHPRAAEARALRDRARLGYPLAFLSLRGPETGGRVLDDGKRALLWGAERVVLVDLESGLQVTSWPLKVYDLAISRGGEGFVCIRGSKAWWVELPTGKPRLLKSSGRINRIEPGPKPGVFLLGTRDGRIHAVRAPGWDRLLHTFGPLPNPIQAMVWSGDRVIAACGNKGRRNNEVRVFDIPTGRSELIRSSNSRVNCLDLHGTTLAFGSNDGRVFLYDLEARTTTELIDPAASLTKVPGRTGYEGIIAGGGAERAHHGPVRGLVFAGNGQQLHTASGDEHDWETAYKVWDMTRRKPIVSVARRPRRTWRMSRSPRSDRLLLGAAGGVEVWPMTPR